VGVAYPLDSNAFIHIMDELGKTWSKACRQLMHGLHIVLVSIQLQQGCHCCVPHQTLLHAKSQNQRIVPFCSMACKTSGYIHQKALYSAMFMGTPNDKTTGS